MIVNSRLLFIICFICMSLHVIARKVKSEKKREEPEVTKSVPVAAANADPVPVAAKVVTPPTGKKNWVVVTTFKNESMIMSDWIQHYINEGVDHFYLIDNGSQDEYMGLLQRFPQQQMITVIRDSSPPTTGLQTILMNKYIRPLLIKDAHWVFVVDIDEYLYAANETACVGDVLNALAPSVKRVWLPWKVFGSNSHLTQPKEGIVAGFTKRKNVMHHHWNQHFLGYGKTIVRVTNVLDLEAHVSHNGDPHFYFSTGERIVEGLPHHNITLSEPLMVEQPLQLNHYMFQSRDYYQRVKCVRGGGQSGRTHKYTMDFFDQYDPHSNFMDDLGLKKRYETLGTRCVSKFAVHA